MTGPATLECPHGIDPLTCSWCRRPKRPERRPAEKIIAARFDGVCPCGAAIVEGDDIGRVDDAWVCGRCFT